MPKGVYKRGPRSPEANAKTAATLRGRKQTAEHVAKRAAANTGGKRSTETCQLLRERALERSALIAGLMSRLNEDDDWRANRTRGWTSTERLRKTLLSRASEPQKKVRALLAELGTEFIEEVVVSRELKSELGTELRYFFDFFIPLRNTYIEVDGCYDHRCPACGFEKARTKRQRENAEHDRDKREFAEHHGLTVVHVWAHETNDLPTLKTRLRQLLA